jgi:hypothetical protein
MDRYFWFLGCHDSGKQDMQLCVGLRIITAELLGGICSWQSITTCTFLLDGRTKYAMLQLPLNTKTDVKLSCT